MAKNNKQSIRSHSQERQWLVNLGKGNLVEGVRSLVQQNQQGSSARNGHHKGHRRKSAK